MAPDVWFAGADVEPRGKKTPPAGHRFHWQLVNKLKKRDAGTIYLPPLFPLSLALSALLSCCRQLVLSQKSSWKWWTFQVLEPVEGIYHSRAVHCRDFLLWFIASVHLATAVDCSSSPICWNSEKMSELHNKSWQINCIPWDWCCAQLNDRTLSRNAFFSIKKPWNIPKFWHTSHFQAISTVMTILNNLLFNPYSISFEIWCDFVLFFFLLWLFSITSAQYFDSSSHLVSIVRRLYSQLGPPAKDSDRHSSEILSCAL